jgi:hypothetical protein
MRADRAMDGDVQCITQLVATRALRVGMQSGF